MSYMLWPLDRWVIMFDEIYGERNKGRTDDRVWLQVVGKAGKLAEDLWKQHINPRYDDKGRLSGMLINVPDTFAWLSAFTSRHGSLEAITWHKFPGICPYCYVDRNCGCITEKPQSDKEKRESILEPYRKNKENYPQTLYGWQEMFDRIYGNINRNKSLEQVGYHLHEEVGEVAEAILHKNEKKLRNELADVFAWLIGLTIKCSDSVGEIFRLDDMVWQRYPNICPSCGLNPCNC